jgi:guanylate kinase
MSSKFIQPGKLIIFSAPSGAGKTTIVHHILKKFGVIEFSVSACSRKKRAGEKEGKDYYFLGVNGFKDKINQNAFVEWQEVYENHFYGTLKSEIDRIWAKGHHVIFDVDVVGGLNLKKIYGERALSIFVMAPTIKDLEDRLKLRDTETTESIARRMAKAEKEMGFSAEFDYILMNDDMQQALNDAEQLVADFIYG